MNRRTRGLAAGVAALGAGAILVGPITALAQSDDEPGSSTPTTEATEATEAPTTTEDTDDTDSSDATGDASRLEQRLQEVLLPLIDSGTLTQAQADAVIQALQDARSELGGEGRGGPRGHHGPGRLMGALHGLDSVADAIGIAVDELRDALADGQTLAQVAEANGVDPQAVIDTLVTEASEWLDEAIADGRLDQEDADERRAELTERITEFVNEGLPARADLDELPRRGPFDTDDDDSTRDEDGDDAPSTTDGTASTEAPTTTAG